MHSPCLNELGIFDSIGRLVRLFVKNIHCKKQTHSRSLAAQACSRKHKYFYSDSFLEIITKLQEI